MEYWDTSNTDKTFFQEFSLRIENQCKAKTLNLQNFPVDVTTYAGATLDLIGLYKETNVTPASGASCPYTATIYVQTPGGTWVESSDPYFTKVIKSFLLPGFSTSGDSDATDIRIKPSVTEFGYGIASSSVVVPIKVKYMIPGSVKEDQFNVTIKPTSAIYELCNINAANMIEVSSP